MYLSSSPEIRKVHRFWGGLDGGRMGAFSFVIKDPDKAYLGSQLWLPKAHVNTRAIKASLEFEVSGKDGQEFLQMWEESPHHLAVPKEYLLQQDYDNLSFPIVDLSPKDFPRTQFTSSLILDLKEPSETTQRDAWQVLKDQNNGLLHLACVAGDTSIPFNRGGKGFTRTIEHAHRYFHGAAPRPWNRTIPTFVRSNKGSVIGLHEVEDIVFRGVKQTYELVLEDGKKIRLTRDHEVLTTRGWVQLLHLKVGDLVVTDGNREGSVRKKKPVYRRLSWYPSHPHVRSQKRKGRKALCYSIEEHRVVAEASLNGISLSEFRERCKSGDVEGLKFIDPDVYHVHHTDEDITNNDPSNLEVLFKDKHLNGHRPGAKAFGYGVPTPVAVKLIKKGKFEKVYDIVCKDPHRNFVANGIVIHNCGKGKTCLALHRVAHEGLNTLIIVNQKTILDQWEGAIAEFLDFDGGVGRIQGNPDTWDWRRPITIATLHTLARYPDAVTPEMRRWFGVIIWDEVHHLSAPYFCITATMFSGKRFGLTATDTREDGTEVVYNYHLGEVFYKDLMQTVKPAIVFRQTPFAISPEEFLEHVIDKRGKPNISKMRTFLGTEKVERNLYQARDIQTALDAGRKVLALSHSRGQLKLMHDLFADRGADVGLCIGTQKVVERWRALRERQLIFGTHQLVLEAIDEDSLDTLYWLTPFGSQHPEGGKNALQQGMGRIQGYRYREGMKHPLVVIFDDVYIQHFHRMCNVLRKQLRRWPADEGGPYPFRTLKPFEEEE
jgi:hypothetical protein